MLSFHFMTCSYSEMFFSILSVVRIRSLNISPLSPSILLLWYALYNILICRLSRRILTNKQSKNTTAIYLFQEVDSVPAWKSCNFMQTISEVLWISNAIWIPCKIKFANWNGCWYIVLRNYNIKLSKSSQTISVTFLKSVHYFYIF